MSSILKRINSGLHAAFEKDEHVHLIGEDLLDPYGGAFKVSAGLSDKYPERIISSPVSEAAITGIAGGMALRGLRPVVEIMFGDFLTLTADQLINSISKFRWMYNEQVDVPIVIRTPMGGRRGYGPTHSQTLEKLFLGVPGLRVLAINSLQDPAEMIEAAILRDDGPVLMIENKLLYAKQWLEEKDLSDYEIERSGADTHYAASFLLRLRQSPKARFTLVAYGYMAELAREALNRLAFEEEIFGELYVAGQISPLPENQKLSDMLMQSVKKTGVLLSVEEGTLSYAWGAEILARAAKHFGSHTIKMDRVGAADQTIPASVAMEAKVLPSIEDIMAAARAMV